MTANVNKFNKIVLSFLKDTSENNNIDELWMASNVQSQVKSLCSSVGGGHEKKNKDPLAPKRGKSGYLYFCSEFRDAVKSSLGEQAKATDVTKELGLRWNALKDSKKPADKKMLAVYEKMAEDDKARYQNEKSSYIPPDSDDSDKPKRRGGKQKSAKNGPKRAKSGYLYFCEDRRNQLKIDNPALKSTEITSELGRLWNELKSDPSQASLLAQYESKALEDKQRYESQKSDTTDTTKPKKEVTKKEPKDVPKKEKEVVKKEAPKKGAKKDDVQEEIVTKKDKVVKDNSKNVVKDTPNKKLNGYQKYSEARRPELKNMFSNEKPADITKRLSDEWKVLSKEDKQKWTDA